MPSRHTVDLFAKRIKNLVQISNQTTNITIKLMSVSSNDILFELMNYLPKSYLHLYLH
jgi:hypothetical protein